MDDVNKQLVGSGTTANDADYQQLHSLYKQSRYRQAYDVGIQKYGPIDQWLQPDLQLLGARILGNLGLYRKADAIFFKLWRGNDHIAKLPSYVINAYHQWKGPLVALEKLHEIKNKPLYEADKAHLLVEEASIMMRYRDFKSAEALLKKAAAEEDSPWIELQYAELEQQQDNYEKALTIADSIVDKHSGYRSAIQKKSVLLEILDRNSEAIVAMEDLCRTSESWWAHKQLFQLLLEAKDHQRASLVLERAKHLPPLDGKELKRHHNEMEADLLCSQEKYDEALPFLEQKSFFQSAIKKSIEEARDKSVRKVLDVPFTRQSNMTCGPASLTSVSKYWGKDVEQQSIVDEICYGGTQAQDERFWVEKNGWYCREFELKFSALKTLIDMNIPVLLSTVDPGSAHLQIIVGYDESMGTYLLRDPYHTRLQEFLIKECEKYYGASGPRCMVMAPLSMSDALSKLHLPSAELYDDLYQVNIAISNKDRSTAASIVNRVNNTQAEHRLAITCERMLAIYDRDEPAFLSTTERLLALFPDDINYQISKIGSLKELGSSVKALDYLESISQEANTHFLILSRLADELRWDQRQLERTEKLYHRLLSLNPIHTQTLYGYAGVLWDKRHYNKSYQIYRFCSCLDDTNENYATSFFKAARFHKEIDQAVMFLVDRFNRFGKQSSGPAISLFNALDSIDKTKEAFEYLASALKMRPEDGDLLLFAAKKHAYIGDQKEAKLLLKKASDYCQHVRFNESAAEIYEITLDVQKALSCCQAVLTVEPLNYTVNKNYIRLLVEQGERDKALDYLKSQLEHYPQNALLQQLIISWTDPNKPEMILAAYADYNEAHPSDTWCKRGLSISYIDLGRYDEAISAAQDAVNIESTDARNYGQLGDAYIAANQPSLANTAFREALKCSCDFTYAYTKLLETSVDHKSQKDAVMFIHNELLNQVSYGDGILEFESAASHCFDNQKIREFLDYALNARSDLWQSWVALTIHLRESNQNQAALDLIESAIGKFPLIPRLFYEKAKTLKVLHKDEESIAALQYTLQLSPGWTWASNELCNLYEKNGDFDAALKLQEKAIQYAPLSPTPYGYIADLQETLGYEEKAVLALEKAIERDIVYAWAWKKYFNLANDKNSVLDKLKHYINTFPENSQLLEIYSELTNQGEESIALIEKYLMLKPNNVDMCVKLIHSYVSNQNFAKAKELVSEPYWNNKRPITIIANEAWIFYCEDNYHKAIEIMNRISHENPNYYDAWRYLAIWHAELGNTKETEVAVENCARLYPHDANVLCFCADKLQSVNSKKDVAYYLKHAFELDVTDQYNGLTYIDYLMDADEIEAASEAQDTLLMHKQNPYVYLRSLRIAANKKDKDTILLYFEKSLKEVDESNCIASYMWETIEKMGLLKEGVDIINSLKEKELLLDFNAGKCLAEYELGIMSLRKFQKTLLQKKANTQFFNRYLESYLRQIISQKSSLPKKIESDLKGIIESDTLNWTLVGYHKLFNEHNAEAASTFMMGLELCNDVEAWMLYYFSIACRSSQYWDKGRELIQQAYSLPSDRFRKDIVIWFAFDKLSSGKKVDESILSFIQPDNLEPSSLYVLSAAKVLLALQDGNFVDGYNQISPLLRECQQHINNDPSNPVMKTVKSVIRNQLKQSLPPMSFLNTLFWKWRLSNHF